MPITRAADSVFVAQLDNLLTVNEANAESIKANGTVRKWNTPVYDTYTGNPLDISGISDAFDRNALNDTYVEAVNTTFESGTGGALSDRIASKIQGDYLAAMERAYRLASATSIRCAFHTSARMTGHGDNRGPFGCIKKHVEDIMYQGYEPRE